MKYSHFINFHSSKIVFVTLLTAVVCFSAEVGNGQAVQLPSAVSELVRSGAIAPGPDPQTQKATPIPAPIPEASTDTEDDPVTSRSIKALLDKDKETPQDEEVKPWHPFDGLTKEKRFGRESLKPDTEVEKKYAADDDDDPPSSPPLSDKFHWKRAVWESIAIQGVQLGYALTMQEKSRRALKGPFFSDYWQSIKGTRGWSDGNRFFTNYIAHPMQGAMTGFIFRQNHDRMKRQKFGESKKYWKDRVLAMAWSAAWSTNWEFGPISQSSVGNVGLYGHQGWVDTVITPTVGTGWMISEEAIDRYVIRKIEKNLLLKIFARSFLNPMRSVANLLHFKEPWYRDPELR